MIEQVQQAGIRHWFGDDLLSIQDGGLKLLQTLFKDIGNCIISGCEITPNGSNYDIAAGYVAINHADGMKIAPFAGVTNQALPGYFSITKTTQQRLYEDGNTKDVSNTYTAGFTSGATPGGTTYLTITTTTNKRLVDALATVPTADTLTLTVTNANVTAQNTVLTINKITKQLHIRGTVTIGNYNTFAGNDIIFILANSGDVATKFRPSAKQYFTAYVQESTPASNQYIKDVNNVDYLKSHVCFIDTNGEIRIRFTKPISGSSMILELCGIVSLL